MRLPLPRDAATMAEGGEDEVRIAVITPHYRPAVRGNAVTVQRIEKGLMRLGCDLTVFPLDEIPAGELESLVKSGGYDICHAFHACYGGAIALRIMQSAGIPYVITLTGSDIYEALFDGRERETRAALHGASAIVAFHDSIVARLAALVDGLRTRPVVIPQGVEPHEPVPVTGEDGFRFLLPAGLRQAKGVESPLVPLSGLLATYPDLTLEIAGPVLDEGYAKELLARLAVFPFASYLGVVDHLSMGELYRRSSVVLNTSRFEGGMANSLLEAMAWGKPVLAAEIEGNRSLVIDGVNGLLYRDAGEFRDKAGLLLTSSELRQRLGMAGHRMVRERHSPEQEAVAYLKLYREIVSTDP